MPWVTINGETPDSSDYDLICRCNQAEEAMRTLSFLTTLGNWTEYWLIRWGLLKNIDDYDVVDETTAAPFADAGLSIAPDSELSQTISHRAEILHEKSS